jgi:hypothetical protein
MRGFEVLAAVLSNVQVLWDDMLGCLLMTRRHSLENFSLGRVTNYLCDIPTKRVSYMCLTQGNISQGSACKALIHRRTTAAPELWNWHIISRWAQKLEIRDICSPDTWTSKRQYCVTMKICFSNYTHHIKCTVSVRISGLFAVYPVGDLVHSSTAETVLRQVHSSSKASSPQSAS